RRSDWLPALNLAYRIRRDRQLRFSYYQALGRPNYGNFRPQVDLPLIPLDQFNSSNQALEFTNSNNLDLTYERYGKRDGLLTVGLYYKAIDRPTVRRAVTQNNALTFTYLTQLVNTDAASVFGLETGIYQSLGAIDERWRHFNVNATYNLNFLSSQGGEGLPNATPLAQAPRQSANLSVVYANPKKRLNLVVAMNYRDRFFDRFLDQWAVWRNNLFSLDISADYEVFKNVSVFVRANNLTDHPFEEWLGEPNASSSNLRSKASYGSWGLLGVRFSAR
ncbi:MAG: TonB-dependent receptor, partial [Bacteroidota bacterium]